MRCLMASSRLHTRCAAGLCSPGRRVTCVAPALGRKMGHIERAAFSPRRAVVNGHRATHTNEQSRVTVTRSRAPHARARYASPELHLATSRGLHHPTHRRSTHHGESSTAAQLGGCPVTDGCAAVRPPLCAKSNPLQGLTPQPHPPTRSWQDGILSRPVAPRHNNINNGSASSAW
jgi:hypothetical protein